MASTPLLLASPHAAAATLLAARWTAGDGRPSCISQLRRTRLSVSQHPNHSITTDDALGHTHTRQPAALGSRSVVQLASNTKPRYRPAGRSFAAPAWSDLTGSKATCTDLADQNAAWQGRCSRKPKPRRTTMPLRHPRPSPRCAAPAIAAGSARSNATATTLAGLARRRPSDVHTYSRRRRRDQRDCGVQECCMHYDG